MMQQIDNRRASRIVSILALAMLVGLLLFTLVIQRDTVRAELDDTIMVEIDIRPCCESNFIICTGGNRLITVAILTTADFDATTVGHTTVTFEGASEIHTDQSEPRRHVEDVDGDGDLDLVFHLKLGDTALTCDSTEGTLVGETFDGQAIEGVDEVHMVAPHGPNGDSR